MVGRGKALYINKMRIFFWKNLFFYFFVVGGVLPCGVSGGGWGAAVPGQGIPCGGVLWRKRQPQGRHPKARIGSPPGLGAGGRLQLLLHSKTFLPFALQTPFPFPSRFSIVLFFSCCCSGVNFLECPKLPYISGTPESSWFCRSYKKFHAVWNRIMYIVLYI